MRSTLAPSTELPAALSTSPWLVPSPPTSWSHHLDPRRDQDFQGTGHCLPGHTNRLCLASCLMCLLSTPCSLKQGLLFSFRERPPLPCHPRLRMSYRGSLPCILGPASIRCHDPSSSFVWIPCFPLQCHGPASGALHPAHLLSSFLPLLPYTPFSFSPSPTICTAFPNSSFPPSLCFCLLPFMTFPNPALLAFCFLRDSSVPLVLWHLCVLQLAFPSL